MKSLNLWDLALDKKEKAKPKALASCVDGNEKFPYFRTTLSPTVVKHFDQMKTWILIITFLSLVGCGQKSNDKKVNSVGLENQDLIESKINPNIFKKWYISYFEPKQKELAFLSEKQEYGKYAIYYQFTFNKDGKIHFDDLTKGYDCGMGILKIDSGNWEVKRDKYLILELEGKYTGDFEFTTKFLYEIVKLNEKEMDLKLVNIDNYCEQHFSRVVL